MRRIRVLGVKEVERVYGGRSIQQRRSRLPVFPRTSVAQAGRRILFVRARSSISSEEVFLQVVGMELGVSLAAPSVQELARSSKDIPTRYVRPELELDPVSKDESVQVPVIDMSKLVGGRDDEEDELAKLHEACRDWGFFQVINHGVAEEVILKMKADVHEFFSLPLQEKMEYAPLPDDIQGYAPSHVVSEGRKLDWSDFLYIVAQPRDGRNMRFWPRVPSSFRETLNQYSTELEKLKSALLSSMARNLGVEPEKLLTLFEGGRQGVRTNYYPPCKQANKVLGSSPHSDAAGLTLLTQVNEVKGLQIKRNGKWIPIDPIQGAFIVNVGDIIEIMSNGEYKSIEHRAVVNPEKVRLSIAAFHNPNSNAVIGPLADILGKDGKKQAPNSSVSPEEEEVFLQVLGMELGVALGVPSVQELAKSLKEVPTRYLRPEFELDEVSKDESVQVPVIDMGKLVGGRDDEEDELAKLHEACRDWGFFQVINHGVAEEVILKMKADVQEFFSLPLEEKMEYARLPDDIQGYSPSQVVTGGRKLDWSDFLYIFTQPRDGRNMRFWPRVPSSFRETLNQYSTELEKLNTALLSFMARNLGLEPEKLLSLFEGGRQGVRTNYYPPCKQADKVIGSTPHSDVAGLTLLTQVNEVQGLQIKRNGKWIPIDPIQGAFIVNVGNFVEIMSNGEYKSVEHRAVVNPEKERLSIATFNNPNSNAVIGPLPDILGKDGKKQAPKYKSMSFQEYMAERLREKKKKYYA
ncbi:unnamed protein product [Linum tenue]|uniref:Fe2OG dioxygenase domain-containing protein n=1 Tax=Linum tenue TaxID=586396 RepID=A0AAV0GVF8_9ROSI|nr:unnamed protein product [Linum tenue]